MPVRMSMNQPSARRRLQFDEEDEDSVIDINRQNIDNNQSEDALAETNNQNCANAFLEEMRQRNNEEMSHKYNFDFSTETPLPGRYEWERVETTSSIEISPALVEARITTIETQQNEQNNLTEAMDCDVAEISAVTLPPPSSSSSSLNENPSGDMLAREQMITPTKSSQ